MAASKKRAKSQIVRTVSCSARVRTPFRPCAHVQRSLRSVVQALPSSGRILLVPHPSLPSLSCFPLSPRLVFPPSAPLLLSSVPSASFFPRPSSAPPLYSHAPVAAMTVPHQPSRRRHRLEWLARCATRGYQPGTGERPTPPLLVALAVLSAVVLSAPVWAGALARAYAAPSVILQMIQNDRPAIQRVLNWPPAPTPTLIPPPTPAAFYGGDPDAWLYKEYARSSMNVLGLGASSVVVIGSAVSQVLAGATVLAWIPIAAAVVDLVLARFSASKPEAAPSRTARRHGRAVRPKPKGRWAAAALRLALLCVLVSFFVVAPVAAMTPGSSAVAAAGGRNPAFAVALAAAVVVRSATAPAGPAVPSRPTAAAAPTSDMDTDPAVDGVDAGLAGSAGSAAARGAGSAAAQGAGSAAAQGAGSAAAQGAGSAAAQGAGSAAAQDAGSTAGDGDARSGAAEDDVPGSAHDDAAGSADEKDVAGSAPAPKRARMDADPVHWGDRSQLLEVFADPEWAAAVGRLGFAINTSIKAVVCVDCGVVVGAEGCDYHIRQHHSDRDRENRKKDLAHLKNLVLHLEQSEKGVQLAKRVVDVKLPEDDPAVQGLVLERRCRCKCGFSSDAKTARAQHEREHKEAAWTVTPMQRVLLGHPYVCVKLPAEVSGGDAGADGVAAGAESGSRPAGETARSARLRDVLTADIPRGRATEAPLADDHTVQSYQRDLGWHIPMDARVTEDVAKRLMSGTLSAAERRVETAVVAWVAWLCEAMKTMPAEDDHVLTQIHNFTGEETDGKPLRALEAGAQATYATTINAFLRFLHRASTAEMRAALTAGTAEGTPAAAASAFSGNVRRPAIDVPQGVRTAVAAMFATADHSTVGAALTAVFASPEMCGVAAKSPAGSAAAGAGVPADGSGSASATTSGGPVRGGASRSERLVRVPIEVQLVSAFMRLRATQNGERLARPDDIGHWSVYLIYAARLAVAQKVIGDPNLRRHELDAVLSLVSYPNAPSPFHSLVSLRRDARTACDLNVSRPQISDVPGSAYRELRILGVERTISLDDLGAMCTRLQASIRCRLLKLTAGVPLLRLDQLHPSGNAERLEFAETTPGKSVIPDRSADVAAALAARGGATAFGPLLTATGLDSAGVNAYLREASELVDELVTLVHISSGQPARGTELAALLWRNTANAERSLYASRGTLVLVQRYAKTRNAIGDQYVPRFLDLDTADVLAAYLAQVRPIETRLLAARAIELDTDEARARVSASDTVLFCRAGKPLPEDGVGSTFRATTESKTVGLGEALGLLQFRHLMVCFARTFLKGNDALLVLMEFVDHQAVHGSQVAMNVYGKLFGQRGRAEDERQFFLLSSAWQQLLGLRFVPGAFSPPSATPTSSAAPTAAPRRTKRPREQPSDQPDAQSTTSSPSATLLPDACATAVSDALRTLLPIHLSAALAHLGFPQPATAGPSRPTSASASAATAAASSTTLPTAAAAAAATTSGPAGGAAPRLVDVSSVQWTSAESTRVHGVLRRLYGKHVRAPTAELAVAMRSLLVEPSRSLLVVLPTGAGKSALLVAEALADRNSSGVVVVVTPLRALAEQTRKLCDRVSVPCSIFEGSASGSLATDTRILLVPAEQVGTDEYVHALAVLNDAGRLRRIIVDEAHQFASESVLQDDFRPKLLRALRSLRALCVDVPVLLLSATVPPALATTLMREATLQQLDIIRAPSTRPNIALTVVSAASDTDAAIEECAVAEAVERVAACTSRERVLLIVRSVDAVDRVAVALRYELRSRDIPVYTYHGKLDSKEQLASATAWASRSTAAAVMVATSGFGTGVDYKHVRAVVHVGGAYSLLDLVQELGRGGRDLQPALHVLVAAPPSASASPFSAATAASSSSTSSSSASVTQYVATSECRGQFLAREIDGVACLPCLVGGRLLCDRCAANNPEHEHDDHQEESDTEEGGEKEDGDSAGVHDTETETETRDAGASSVRVPQRAGSGSGLGSVSGKARLCVRKGVRS